MKKLFVFRSSSNNGNNNGGSPPLSENQVRSEFPKQSGMNNQIGDKDENSRRGLFSKSRKQVYNSKSQSTSSGLRRSRSLSSAAFLVDGPDRRSPSSSADNSFHSRVLMPERQAKPRQLPVGIFQNAHAHERPNSSGSSKSQCNSSGISTCSNTSVLDRYIDGEQQLERSKPKKCSSQNCFIGNCNGNGDGMLPPRVQYQAPTSPTDTVRTKARSHSFREPSSDQFHFSSRDLVDNGFGHESPRRLAKNVIEKLSQSRALPKSSSKEFSRDIPITIEDIYGGSVDKCYDVNVDIPPKIGTLQDSYAKTNNCQGDIFSSFQKQYLYTDSFGDTKSFQNKDIEDFELQQRSKEAEERVVHLSEELEQEKFFQVNGFDVPSLINTIRNLAEDKVSLAIEVSGLLKSRIVDRDSAKEDLRLVKEELDSHIRRLEKEKNELQSALEKELDRRSSDWSLKLEKCRLEEQRLRERVRELAEHNVSLQREISTSTEREMESRSMVTNSEQQLNLLGSRIEELSEENKQLKQEFCELKEKYEAAEEQLDCIKRNFEDKDKECKEQQRSITRMLRTCNEQEKTIEGLRDRFGEEIEKQESSDRIDRQLIKLKMEQIRLTGVELAIRREMESHRLEVDSLRQENINLLERLKANGEEFAALTFKLDKEMWSRVCCLQNQGVTMLNEGVGLCSKLLQHIKEKAGQNSECKQGGLDGQFVVESEMKVQAFKRGTESLTRSLQTISFLLQQKSDLVATRSPLPCTTLNGLGMLNHKTSEEAIKSELKVETMLTSLLREKLYSKELEVEQLQAELAAAARGNDVLQCEVHNALDNLSCVSHKLKDSELQMRKKDEIIYQLQSELQESDKELTRVKAILLKVSQERDLMWEEVKQYNEKNMLLNSEVNMLKKKIEALDEAILEKEGQISILKDTIAERPFEFLASPDTQEYLLK